MNIRLTSNYYIGVDFKLQGLILLLFLLPTFAADSLTMQCFKCSTHTYPTL
jgi:hypothetical protein